MDTAVSHDARERGHGINHQARQRLARAHTARRRQYFRNVQNQGSGLRMGGYARGGNNRRGARGCSAWAHVRKAKARALVEGLHFHDTRAEALTRLSKKLDALRLAKISGHKDLRILLATYYRESAEDVARLLD